MGDEHAEAGNERAHDASAGEEPGGLDGSSSPRPGASAGDEAAARSPWVFLRDLLIILVVALVISTLLKSYVVRTFYIPSGSMEPTLQVGDRVLVSRLTPSPFELKRGDVVVFSDPGGWLSNPPSGAQGWSIGRAFQDALTLVGLADSDSHQYLVKRVIGLGGDHVVCANVGGPVTVNGVTLDESAYLSAGTPPCARTFDVVVDPNGMWVMGDNRGNSLDSGYHVDDPGRGSVPVNNVVGKAFQITWPLSRFSGVTGPGETFDRVPAAG